METGQLSLELRVGNVISVWVLGRLEKAACLWHDVFCACAGLMGFFLGDIVNRQHTVSEGSFSMLGLGARSGLEKSLTFPFVCLLCPGRSTGSWKRKCTPC